MNRPLLRSLLGFLLLVPGVPTAGQDILDPKLRDLLTESLSGDLAKEHVVEITRHHRIQGSRGFLRAAEYALGQLRAFGCPASEALIESYASDGRTTYQTWQSPSGWDIASGELRMVKPSPELLVRFPEVPMSVVTCSDTGDATAPLVYVGGGTTDKEYEGKDVKGKFVLATGYATPSPASSSRSTPPTSDAVSTISSRSGSSPGSDGPRIRGPRGLACSVH